jgi:acetolactate synthase-1/2/3 large subunit
MAQALCASRVRYVFGHPGGEVVDTIDSLERSGIPFMLTGHETAAAFMAATVGRITDVPGVCLATLGPGACNLVLGVGAALLDRDPLLAISGRTTEARRRWNAKQNLPLNELFAPITKWSAGLDGVDIEGTVRRAIRVARTPPRGPVFLSLSADIAGGPARDGAMTQTTGSAVPAGGGLEAISRALNRAARPIGLVGVALDGPADHEAVRCFFRQTGIPYAATPQAKGVADESGDLYLGTVGAGAGDDFIVKWLNQSDCLLGVGFDPVESSYDWHIRRPLYSVANSSIRFGDYSPAAECIGDVTILLGQLLSAYTGSAVWDAGELEEVRRRTRALLCSPLERGAFGLSPFHLVRTLRQGLPPETMVTADVGAHKMLLTQTWHTSKPNQFLVSNGLSAMGFGVPAAIAAAVLHPEVPVAGFIGDGGFAMMVQELETARRLGAAPLFVVFCDRALAIVKMAQKVRGMRPIGVDFDAVDWAKVAEGFGAKALAPATLQGVRDAVERWLACRELTVLAVPVDPELYCGLSY